MNSGDLKRLRFDNSFYDMTTRTWRAGCSKCTVTITNGHPAHEVGCSNLEKTNDRRNREKNRRVRAEKNGTQTS